MGFIARIKGEEPNLFAKIPHALEGKGHYGEYLSEYALEHGDLGEIAVYSNVLVPRESGPTSTSEIDVLMLHEKGIFVIESKNYSGWIFGSADQQKWTMCLKGGAKEHFYNPIKQNRSHVKALANYLGLPYQAFHSYIVFSERCELKDVPDDTADYVICRRPNLLKRVREDLKYSDTVFSENDLAFLDGRLKALADGSTNAEKAAHVEEARKVASGEVCPWCGSKLVMRNGKNGPFMGCSGYPKCRYTRSV